MDLDRFSSGWIVFFGFFKECEANRSCLPAQRCPTQASTCRAIGYFPLIFGVPFQFLQGEPAMQVVNELPGHPSRAGAAVTRPTQGIGIEVPRCDLQTLLVAEVVDDGQVGFLSHGVEAESNAEPVREGNSRLLLLPISGYPLRSSSNNLQSS